VFFWVWKKNYVKSCCALFKNVCGKCWLLNFLCLEKKMSLQGVYVNVSLGEKFCERKIIWEMWYNDRLAFVLDSFDLDVLLA
jgi:hypothetical protein